MTVLALPFAFNFSRTFAFDRYVGELSYPIYISHLFVLEFLTGRCWGHPADQAKGYIEIFVLAFSLLLSIILVQFVEKPIDHLRHRLARVQN
jgi:peptidoglycan/LPS O-acetylase OafA/YrhL